jgi:hypothetical protein
MKTEKEQEKGVERRKQLLVSPPRHDNDESRTNKVSEEAMHYTIKSVTKGGRKRLWYDRESRSVKFMMKCRSCNVFYFWHESYQPTQSPRVCDNNAIYEQHAGSLVIIYLSSR